MTHREMKDVHFFYPVLPHAGRALRPPISDPHKLNVADPTQYEHGVTTCSETWNRVPHVAHYSNGTNCIEVSRG